MSKPSALLIIAILVVSSLIIVESVFAQSVTKPSVPEFILKYIDLSYNVPPTYGTDQYTGQTIIIQDGYHVDNRSIQFTIKNQPFTPFTDANGTEINLYYNFRIKGTYGTEWDYYPFMPDGQSSNNYGGPFTPPDERPPAPAFSQSNAEYTTVTITIPGVWRVPQDSPLDVQAQALAGYMYFQDKQYHFVGQYSDWSNTQTIVIGESQTPTPTPPNFGPTSSPSQEPTLTQEQLETIIIVAIAVAGIGAGIGLPHQKKIAHSTFLL